MGTENKKHAVSLGIRIGIVFFLTILIVITAAYFVLLRNVQNLFTEYTITMVEAMTDQGVDMIETELNTGKSEAVFLANAFQLPVLKGDEAGFPKPYIEGGYLRMVYVTQEKAVASDGSVRDHIQSRADIQTAFSGETAVYGPYYNAENEFVVCYSAPVRQENEIVGVLAVEKNGYRFCEVIQNIRFINSGESYIINEDGTDIAVSDPNHMEWVTSQYNAQKLLEENGDEETGLILELERKGLNGESGVGTYSWEDGLVYVFYRPIPSVNWVLLAGMRRSEIVAMTYTALLSSVSDGPVLGICLFFVVLLTILIIYWIISSMKKNADINEGLRRIANYDSLTGLLNRNSYHAVFDTLLKEQGPVSCVYVDVNGLHELNNHLGHSAGDDMLKAVAGELRQRFPLEDVYRIGGDEFVVLRRGRNMQKLRAEMERVRQSLHDQNYDISIGIACCEEADEVNAMLQEAEAAMQEDKKWFYQNNGNERRMRILDESLKQTLLEKQDADTFLAVLEPVFSGVYFVNLSVDTVRSLYIPDYFESCLQEMGRRFSKALLLYAERNVLPEYLPLFHQLCDYLKLEGIMKDGNAEFDYEKVNGDRLHLRILKFKDYTPERRETLWIFSNAGRLNMEIE